MDSLFMTKEQFRSIASLAVAACKDDVMRVITGVSLKVVGDEVTAVATDRYRIARVQFATGRSENMNGSDFETLIPASYLTKFWASIKGNKDVGLVTLTLDENGVTLNHGGVSSTTDVIVGSFPPVDKLLVGYDEESATGVPSVQLNATYLADLTKLFHPLDDSRGTHAKDVPWRFIFKQTESSKPGPVYISRDGSNGAGGTLEYLVQPRLVRS